MANRPKQQGTAFESWLVGRCVDAGLVAERIAEAGIHDIGDIRIHLAHETWIVEAKARQNLPLHRTLHQARKKAAPHPAAVAWRRLLPTWRRRQPDGERIIVAITLDDFLQLIASDLDQEIL